MKIRYNHTCVTVVIEVVIEVMTPLCFPNAELFAEKMFFLFRSSVVFQRNTPIGGAVSHS